MTAKSQATRNASQNGFERSASQRGPNTRNSAAVVKLATSGHSRLSPERDSQEGRAGGGIAGRWSCLAFMSKAQWIVGCGIRPGSDVTGAVRGYGLCRQNDPNTEPSTMMAMSERITLTITVITISK